MVEHVDTVAANVHKLRNKSDIYLHILHLIQCSKYPKSLLLVYLISFPPALFEVYVHKIVHVINIYNLV